MEKLQLIWNKPDFYLGTEVFTPKIFEAYGLNEEVPAGFNAVKIAIKGGLKADLDWREASKAAQEYVKKGLFLLWELDLDLFSRLAFPLSHQSQYLSLHLALEHFQNTLWKDFREHTIGLSIYQGSLDFSIGFPLDEEQVHNIQGWIQDRFHLIESFNEENAVALNSFQEITPDFLKRSEYGKRLLSLFCRNAAFEYLELLTAKLPDGLTIFLLFDAASIKNLAFQAQLLTKAHERFLYAVKNSPLTLIQDLAWEEGRSLLGFYSRKLMPIESSEMSAVGICLPAEHYHAGDYEKLELIIQRLTESRISYRIVSEANLITEWDGLDYLLVVRVTPQGRRKLQGFCAAGGCIVYTGNSFDMPNEVSFNEWICH